MRRNYKTGNGFIDAVSGRGSCCGFIVLLKGSKLPRVLPWEYLPYREMSSWRGRWCYRFLDIKSMFPSEFVPPSVICSPGSLNTIKIILKNVVSLKGNI